MNEDHVARDLAALEAEELREHLRSDVALSRRDFVQLLGAGLLISASAAFAADQRRGGRGGGQIRTVAARIHLGQDGAITVLTGKVEMGQGARAELSQAAAEELRVPVDRIQMLMGDTSLVPDDGLTAGSRTTPATVPVVRQAAAAARQLLAEFAAQRWGVEPGTVVVREGAATHAGSQPSLGYTELARSADVSQLFQRAVPADIGLTAVTEWQVLGASVPRPNRRDLVTGVHKFPSDVIRPGMLYGKILRPPAYGASLASVDVAPAKALADVVVVQDGQFVGVAAPTTHRARQALELIAATARWENAPHPSSRQLFAHLRQHAQGGVPANPFPETLGKAKQVLRQTYQAAYVQHAPLEPRVAVAEWQDGRLTVWTGTQNPFGYHGELARTFGLTNDQVRVVVPDFGSGFGGKHTGEAAIEAARLARAAQRPVSLRWTRDEEFTWACFRPAALIDVEASLDERGAITSWHFVNVDSGPAAIDTPYRVPQARSRFVGSDAPLRQSSYRALAATANNFAREVFLDELAAAAGADPLDFRLAHLDNERLRAVLEAAAARFSWRQRVPVRQPDVGVGLACGTEKGSYVAACVEVAVDRARGRIEVRRVCEVFECGAVLNPDNLRTQVMACIIMGLGPALEEEIRFENGKILNPNFDDYQVPRFRDVPELDIHQLNRPDLPSVGGGETPIIAVAPAIANAVFHATGVRVRAMPIRWPATGGTDS